MLHLNLMKVLILYGRSGNGRLHYNNLAGFETIQGEITLCDKLLFSTNQNINIT